MAGRESLEASDGALECADVAILMSLSSSSVPRMYIHIYIKKITEQQVYIYKKVRKRVRQNVMSKMQVLHSTPPKKRSSYTVSKITPLKIMLLISY